MNSKSNLVILGGIQSQHECTYNIDVCEFIVSSADIHVSISPILPSSDTTSNTRKISK